MKPLRIGIWISVLGLLAGAWLMRDRTAHDPAAPAARETHEPARPAISAQPIARTETISAEKMAASTTSERRKSIVELASNSVAPPQQVETTATANLPTMTANTINPTGTRKPKPPLVDPLARLALYFVGTDPLAEEVWFDAINNPNLPAKEREDLIEDLNELGLPDPKHPTLEDLPLILSRMMLIEMVGPDAMDQVNADAFQEAYKDLVNLADVAMGGGVPVK